jgi:molybdopterin-guanine dinucleotide biosynthesis protein A
LTPIASLITGVIYSGGGGTRFGGRDKGWVRLAGRPLACLAAARLAPQVAAVCFSINRNGSRYRALGLRVVRDRGRGFDGPLAGLLSVMAEIDSPYIVTLPCDSPVIPADYVERLWRRLRTRRADICIVRDRQGLHPLHALMKTRLRADLAVYLAAGGAAAHHWVRRQRWTAIDLPVMNINSRDEWRLCTIRTRGARSVPLHGAETYPGT